MITVSMAFFGCSTVKGNNYSKYDVLIYDFSNSVENANHNIEFEFADHNKYDAKSPKSNFKLDVNGKNVKGSYQLTQYRDCNYFPVYRYIDDANRSF